MWTLQTKERKLSHSETLSHQSTVLNNLRLEGHFCDAVIRVGGTDFKIHKVIFCSFSPWFRSFFEHWSALDQTFFEISGISAHIMQLIVEFAYTGMISVTTENVQDLLQTADQYNLMDIVQICCSFLEKELCPKNCIGIWKFTQFIYTPDLEAKAYRYITDHFEEVAVTEEFVELPVQALYRLLKRDQLNVKKESNAFEAILRWIAHAPGERGKNFFRLFSKVRLALTSEDYIRENVMSNELVWRDKQCMQLVTNARHIIWRSPNRPGVSRFCDPPARPRLPTAILLTIGGFHTMTDPGFLGAYDVRSDHWLKMAVNWEPGVGNHGTVFHNGCIYCLGGYDTLEYYNTVHRLDLQTHTWTEVAPMHYARSLLTGVALNGYIYAIGGQEGHRESRSAERYNPDTNQWSLIAPMNYKRSNACCATLHSKIYICGGFNENGFLQTAESYNPVTNQWTMIPPMLSRRCGVGVAAYAGRIFVVGGFDGNDTLQTAEVYDPKTNTWQQVSSMLTPRSNLGIGVIEDKLFVVGGFNGSNITSKVEFYDHSSGEWFPACDLELSRNSRSCCVVSGLPNLLDYVRPRDLLPLLLKDNYVL